MNSGPFSREMLTFSGLLTVLWRRLLASRGRASCGAGRSFVYVLHRTELTPPVIFKVGKTLAYLLMFKSAPAS